MLGALQRLAIGLQAVPERAQHASDRREVNVMPMLPQPTASCRTLLEVHNNTCIGSPRQSSATSRSSTTIRAGSVSLIDLRPPPRRRTRRPSSRAPLISRIPFRIVFSEIPLALDTAAIPPRPGTRASDAAQIRLPRSLNSGANARNRSPITRSSITPHSSTPPGHNPSHYLSTIPSAELAARPTPR